MQAKRAFMAVTIALIAVIAATLPASAQSGGPRRGRVVALLIETASADDLFSSGLVNMQRTISQGAVGLMTTRTSGGLLAEKILLTMSAGNMSFAGPWADVNFNSQDTYFDQPVESIYRARTGHEAPQQGVVAMEIASIWRRIADSDTTGHPGLLGSSLRHAGYKTAVLGNSDTVLNVRRPGVLLAMDDAGRVDLGSAGMDTMIADPAFPGGYRTDIEAVQRHFGRLPDDVGLAVVEFGDLARVELEVDRLMDNMIPVHRAAALQRADDLLGRLARSIDPQRDLLMVLGVVPPKKLVNDSDRLAPVILYGRGVRRGLVESMTTRTRGLMTPEDVTATIYEFLNVQPLEPIVGRPVLTGGGSLDELARARQGWIVVEQQRRPILEGYVCLLIIGILGAALLIFFWPNAERLCRVARVSLVVLATVPLAFLLLPLLRPSTVLTAGLGSLALTAVLSTVFLLARREPVDSLAWVSGLTVLAVFVDTITGGFLLHRSVLSYSPMVGARFYGMGNEYMGIVIGAAIVAGATVVDRFGRHRQWMTWVVYAAFLAVAAAVALPQLGANVGGALTAVTGFIATALMIRGRRLSLKEVLIAGAGAIAVLTLLVVNEVLGGPDQMTHLGRTFVGVSQSGPSWFFAIVQRKIAMNLRLFRYTYWTWVLIAFLFILPVLFKRPPHVLGKVFKAHPVLRKGFIGSVLASVVALAANDSGVVAAATCMIYAGMGLIYMVLHEVGGHTSSADRSEDDLGAQVEVSQ